MGIQLVITRSHAAKLLEAAKQALDGLPLGVAHGVVGAGLAALPPWRNDGAGAPRSQGGDQRVGIVAAVGDELSRGQLAEQRQGLRGVVALARGQAAAHEAPAGIGHHVHLTGQATATAAQGLRPVFLRAPLACWCARTVVESSSNVCNASSCCTAAKTRAHTPLRAQRWNRM